MADTLAILEHHGVHRADALGFGREFVEQRDDCLLARKRDVQTSEVHALSGHQQLRQGRAVEVQLIEVDQPIDVAHALGIALVLMQRGGSGGLDAGANQSGEYACVLCHVDYPCKR
ncbi:hypothetical protein D3C85_1677190 [compost metagenome]